MAPSVAARLHSETCPAPAPRKKVTAADVIQWTGSNFAEVTSFAWQLFHTLPAAAAPFTGEIYDAYADRCVPVKTGQWIIHHGWARFTVHDDAGFRTAYELAQPPAKTEARWSM